ncbi:hypothetical protein I4I73_01205 [Pseudonocardia sp. KRD-184]|uniref:Integral membrane protein n=1 Tax=Pseudonocardia oceani TaxID=2792013 RepID=A0ABS6UB30_9PSEU|nr:hypothetical protein [Pseudonocardia oceani]MBW0089776.1 hypothetical protein [Pseudonocardia oceani]MBW0094626.1 hypothetical protein [Pseudonocardia oceani]MBW0109483.1 hypothetical protein [Pseudonocardia oceani]MBW0119884.1 hypothetical protein [Pseudonocardia oceani]MBW0129447.1 hypothetical protein [Pseudonocardia oceani]
MNGVATTAAVARYVLAEVVRSQRWLPPLLLFAAVHAVFFGGDPGPPPVPWAASALALYPVAAWVALVVAHVDDPARRALTASAAGGWAPVAAATALVALLGDALLVALAVAWPVVLGRYPYPPATVLLGVVAHLATALTGTAVGLLCARPVVTRIGRSVLLVVTVVVVTAVQPWLPPVGTAVAALTAAGPPPLPDAALALALLTAAASVAWAVDRRR